MPKKFSIQYTGNVPWPYATGLPVITPIVSFYPYTQK
jgi:hypothetical protein